MPMKNIHIELQGMDQLKRVLQRAGDRAPAALAGPLFRFAEEQIANPARLQVPVDLGALRSSIQVKPAVLEHTAVSVSVGAGNAAAPYALYVHEGTGPAVGRPAYFPPVKVLEGWAKRHGMNPFAVAMAIFKRGTKPKKYLETPALEAASRGDDLARRVEKEVEKLFGRG